MTAAADDYPLGEHPPGMARFDPYNVPHSGAAAVLQAADRIAAHKAAVDEIRAYCAGVAKAGSSAQVAVVTDVLKILQHHRLT